MEEFGTLEAVGNLFRQVNGEGAQNNYFMGYIAVPTSAGFLGGAIGTLAAGAVVGMENDCDGFIVDLTENGLGMMPLINGGLNGFTFTPKKMKANPSAYFFVPENEIKSVAIKRYNLISMVTKKVIIELNNGRKINLVVNVKEKLLPYHESGFANFMAKYSKK